MRKPRSTRNIILILLAFVLIGILVILARSVSGHIVPPESPEVARLRFSETENGWYVLQHAMTMIPPLPAVDLRKTVDFLPGPMGRFTDIYLPDDDPAHMAWVRSCKTAMDRARDALKLEQCLVPIDFAKDPNLWRPIEETQHFLVLPSVMLATSYLQTKEGDPDLALDYFRDALRLHLTLKNITPPAWPVEIKSLSSLARAFTPEMRRQALPWLIEFNKSKPPPRRAVEDLLRMSELWRGGFFSISSLSQIPDRLLSMPELVGDSSARRKLAANPEAVMDALCMTQHEYDEWSTRSPDLAKSIETVFSYALRYFRHSEFQLWLDSAEIVLAIESYRDSHGAYPDSLAALVPEFLPVVPVNAFAGEPFKYQRAEDAYWLAQKAADDKDPSTFSQILIRPPQK